MARIEPLLRQKLTDQLQPIHLEILNESPMHGLTKEAEKHFRVIIVSAKFDGLSRVERHRLVHEVVAQELKQHIHALAVQTMTEPEWVASQGQTIQSPECLGGGKREGLK